MNKIVREHYPVSKLPEDLRPSDSDFGRLTIEVANVPRVSLTSILERAAELRREGKVKPISSEEAVARIRAQRDGIEP